MSDLFSSADIYESDDPSRILTMEAQHLQPGWEVMGRPGRAGVMRWIRLDDARMVEDGKRVDTTYTHDGERVTVRLLPGSLVTARPPQGEEGD